MDCSVLCVSHPSIHLSLLHIYKLPGRCNVNRLDKTDKYSAAKYLTLFFDTPLSLTRSAVAADCLAFLANPIIPDRRSGSQPHGMDHAHSFLLVRLQTRLNKSCTAVSTSRGSAYRSLFLAIKTQSKLTSSLFRFSTALARNRRLHRLR